MNRENLLRLSKNLRNAARRHENGSVMLTPKDLVDLMNEAAGTIQKIAEDMTLDDVLGNAGRRGADREAGASERKGRGFKPGRNDGPGPGADKKELITPEISNPVIKRLVQNNSAAKRRSQADRAFAAYTFSGLKVVQASDWEVVTSGEMIISMSRSVLLEVPERYYREAIKADFSVQFGAVAGKDDIVQAAAKSTVWGGFPTITENDVNRIEMAEFAFSDYQFPHGIVVGEEGQWREIDTSPDGTIFRFRKTLFLRSDRYHGSEAGDFEVIFDQDDSGSVLPLIVRAFDSQGNEIGHPDNRPDARAPERFSPAP